MDIWRDILMTNSGPKIPTTQTQKPYSSSFLSPKPTLMDEKQNKDAPKFLSPKIGTALDSEKFGWLKHIEDISGFID